MLYRSDINKLARSGHTGKQRERRKGSEERGERKDEIERERKGQRERGGETAKVFFEPQDLYCLS